MSPETAATIRHAADVVQWFNLAAALAIMLLALEMGRRFKSARPYLVGPISLAAHSILFYLVALLGRMPGPVASFWSALLRLHIYLVILAVLLAAFVVAISPAPPGWPDYEDGPHE